MIEENNSYKRCLIYGHRNTFNEIKRVCHGLDIKMLVYVKDSIFDNVGEIDTGNIVLREDDEIVILDSYEYEKAVQTQLSARYVVVSFEKWMANLLTEKIHIRPTRISIDASTFCQLDCVDCYMRKNNYDGVGRGHLSFENLKKIVEGYQYVKQIELSNNGEALLAPDLICMLKYLFEKGIRVTLYNGVNLNTASDELLRAMVLYQVKGITVSIDGATQGVYEKYRRKGNIDKVFKNIDRINYYKKLYSTDFPILKWQYIVMSHNECDIEKAKEVAKEKNMEIFFKQNWGDFSRTTNSEYVRRITGMSSLIRDKESYQWGNRCRELLLFPHINWDGRLIGCCSSHTYDFGINVIEKGLEKALNTKEYFDCIRTVFLKEKFQEQNTPCSKCWIYQQFIVE